MDKIVGDVAILDNGTSWRLPRNNRDLIWRCTWAQDSITSEDLLVLASYLENYQYLIESMTQKQRNLVCSKINKLTKGFEND